MKHFNPLRLSGVMLLFAFFTGLSVAAQTLTPKYISMMSKTKGYYEYLPQGYSPTGTATYPLILFMTGIGEFGDGSSSQLPLVLKNGVPKLIKEGTFPKSFTSNGLTHKFIVITPQFLKGSSPTAADMNAVLTYITSHYKVNTKRVYITGLSYGGGLSFAYPGGSSTYASRVAAVVPVASPLPDGGYTTIYNRSRIIAAGNVPVWATHNSGDKPDSASRTIAYINYINQAPAPKPLAKKTIFSAGGHDAWTKTYDIYFRENGYNIYEWMLLYQKGSAPPPYNAAPKAYAGSDKVITQPTSSVTLSGSGTDSDGSIVSYSWIKYSGPAEGTITSPTAKSTSVTGLVPGIYTFRLMVSDNKSAKAIDDIKVTVNYAPGTKVIQVNIYGGSNIYSNTSWNNWSVGTAAATNKTSAAFKYFDGTTSTVSAVLSATSAMADNTSLYATGVAMAPAPVLRYASYYTGVRTLTLKGLSTTKTYNLELYASRNSTTAGNTLFTVNGVTKTINASNNLTTKALFTSVKPNSSGQIVVSINKSSTYNYLNGFKLTQNATTTALTQASAITGAEQKVAANQSIETRNAAFTIYPNPAAGAVRLTLNNTYSGMVQVRISDVAGASHNEYRFVKNGSIVQQTIPIASLPAGTYYVIVQMGELSETRKLIKY
jgi:dienelactone hydrolase